MVEAEICVPYTLDRLRDETASEIFLGVTSGCRVVQVFFLKCVHVIAGNKLLCLFADSYLCN